MSEALNPINIYIGLISYTDRISMYRYMEGNPDAASQKKLLAELVETVSDSFTHEKLKWSGIELRFGDEHRAAKSPEEFAERIFELRDCLGYREIFERKLDELLY